MSSQDQIILLEKLLSEKKRENRNYKVAKSSDVGTRKTYLDSEFLKSSANLRKDGSHDFKDIFSERKNSKY